MTEFQQPPPFSPIFCACSHLVRLHYPDSWESSWPWKPCLICLETHFISKENVYSTGSQDFWERMSNNLLRIFHLKCLGGSLSKHPIVCEAHTMLHSVFPGSRRNKLLFQLLRLTLGLTSNNKGVSCKLESSRNIAQHKLHKITSISIFSKFFSKLTINTLTSPFVNQEGSTEAPPHTHLSVLASGPSEAQWQWRQVDLCQVNPCCKQGLFLGQWLLWFLSCP